MDERNRQENVALLLFLSDYKSANDKAVYRFVTGDEYEGTQTNDAPVECLLDMALKKMAESDKEIRFGQDKKIYILCITSHEVVDTKIKAGKTAWINFQDTLLKKMQEEKYEKYIEIDNERLQDLFEFIPIPYDYGDNYTKFTEEDEDTNQMAQRIFGEINARLKENDIKDVYVDYTGGMRDVNFLMTTIIRYLEFKGINCQKIVYSQYDKNNSENNRIRDITYIYEMFQMINGVNEFITTGHATALNEIFKSEREKAESREEKEEDKVKKLLENMVAFSNAMSICDVSNIEEYLKSIRDSINELESDVEKTDTEDKKNSDNPDLKVAMLKQLLPIMREKMYLEYLGQKDYYIKLINWCAENNMLQQALTLIEDKMPEVYIGEESSNKVITYKFAAGGNKEEFLEILGNSWDKEVNKIFYSLQYCRTNAPNILTHNECTEYYVELKKLLGTEQDQVRVLRKKYIEGGHKTKMKHSVLKCLGDNISYTITEKIKQQGQLAPVTRTAEITMKCTADIEKLKQLFYLHNILKQERNDCNHASDKGNRFSFDTIKALIRIYVKRTEEAL